MSRYPALLLALSLAGAATAQPELPVEATLPYPVVELDTTMGRVVVQLDRPRAPVTVENFIRYVVDGHYDGTVFHRVIDGFVVQGGGYDAAGNERPTRANIVNESGNGLSNEPGTIAMARHDDPHTASAQWYINVGENQRLDPSPRRWGYAVFGRVIIGQDVVERIAQVETGERGGMSDVPLEPILVRTARVIAPPEVE